MSDISTGWYIPLPNAKVSRQLPRWVLGVVNGRVCYSKGGTKHCDCSIETFQKWMRNKKAERQSDV